MLRRTLALAPLSTTASAPAHRPMASAAAPSLVSKRREVIVVGLSALVAVMAVAGPADADPPACPVAGGWELYTEDHPAVEATDRNGDGYVCARFYDNDRVPHRAVLTDNHR